MARADRCADGAIASTNARALVDARFRARAMSSEGKARASHVLVKHAGSRRPASWRDPEGAHIAKKARRRRPRADGWNE